MMFKFNFNKDDSAQEPEASENEAPAVQCNEYEEVQPTKEQFDKFEDIELVFLNEMQFDGDRSVFYVPIDDIMNTITQESKDINSAEQNHLDVVPGVYEGGAKVWECTQDLGHVLTRAAEDNTSIIDGLESKTILDLGCGSGILGIIALKAGATVHFQDYNKTVLKHITIPNVIVNVDEPQKTIPEKCKFFSGDWESYTTATPDGPKFDQILTSETIYNPSNYKKILNLFKTKLKEDGVIYLAAKSLYFGVGGSVRQFEDAIRADGTFHSKVIYNVKENVPRQILEIKFAAEADNK